VRRRRAWNDEVELRDVGRRARRARDGVAIAGFPHEGDVVDASSHRRRAGAAPSAVVVTTGNGS